MKKNILIVLIISALAISCQREDIALSEALQASQDTINFSLVLGGSSSTTRKITIRNRSDKTIHIRRIMCKKGTNFYLNVDGETGKKSFENITLEGKDSMYIFLQFYKALDGTPHLQQHLDMLTIQTAEQTLEILLNAYSQEVIRVEKETFTTLRMDATMPYWFGDTITITDSLLISPGTIIYMHNHATIIVRGSIVAQGTVVNPIVFRPDRLDEIYTNVPYYYVSGFWNGIYVYDNNATMPTYLLDNVQIISCCAGLSVASTKKNEKPMLALHNCYIHNCTASALNLHGVNSTMDNCLFSNCGHYALHANEGEHTITQTTFANFYGYPYTNMRIFENARENVPVVYFEKNTRANIHNSIVAGASQQSIAWNNPEGATINAHITNNCLIGDTLPEDIAQKNWYTKSNDSLFINIFYLSGSRRNYYDFHLDSLSIARGRADVAYTLSQQDISGVNRKTPADIGCYEYVKY